MITILSVEDHPVFREGLGLILGSQPDMQLAGQASTAEEALEAYRRSRPDVTLMDVRLPGTDGIDALAAIRREFPDARIVILSTSDGDGDITRALRAGAAGYLLKSARPDELLAAIRVVHRGGRHVALDVAARLAPHLGDASLTPREREVLGLIREGLRNKQIAAQLEVSETTINFHIKNITQKLGANDRAHALAIALRRGLLPG